MTPIRTARSALACVVEIARFGIPDRLVSVGCGMGDELMATCAIHELKRRDSRPLWLMSEYPSLHAENADIDHVTRWRPKLKTVLLRLGVEHIFPMYHARKAGELQLPDEPSLLQVVRNSGVRGRALLRPYLPISDREQSAVMAHAGAIVIQSSARAARYSIETKEWFSDRLQRVASALAARYPIVQLGSRSDPPLKDVHDLRGRTSLRESAAILGVARAFFGLEGFMMHVARAVQTRAVIVIGGRTRWFHYGYPCNENLAVDLSCSGCMLKTGCPHDMRCMRQVSVEDALAAMDRLLARADQPLETFAPFVTDSRPPLADVLGAIEAESLSSQRKRAIASFERGAVPSAVRLGP